MINDEKGKIVIMYFGDQKEKKSFLENVESTI
jgi:hypothetical protein